MKFKHKKLTVTERKVKMLPHAKAPCWGDLDSDFNVPLRENNFYKESRIWHIVNPVA